MIDILEVHPNSPHSQESIDDTQIMMENTPHYLLRSHQKHSAGYNLPPYPLIASFLSLPFNKVRSTITASGGRGRAEFVSDNYC